MTNGQQLEMVDGTLVEIVAPTIQARAHQSSTRHTDRGIEPSFACACHEFFKSYVTYDYCISREQLVVARREVPEYMHVCSIYSMNPCKLQAYNYIPNAVHACMHTYTK
jgi:hypothetical protein